MSEEDTERGVGSSTASVAPPLVESSYDAMRRELQRLAAEKKKIRDDLRDLSFKARALQPSQAMTGPHRSDPAEETVPAASSVSITEDDTTGSASRQKRSRAEEINANEDQSASQPESMEPAAKRAKVESVAVEEDKNVVIVGEPSSTVPQPPQPSAAPPPPIKVQKDRRMFQNIMGTLQGLKRQMQHGKVADTLAQRHALEVQADERILQNSAKQAEEFRAKYESDRSALQQRDSAVHDELLQKEELLYSWIVQQYDSELLPWLLTPPEVGTVIAWRPGKRDSLVESFFLQNAPNRPKTTVSRAPDVKVDQVVEDEDSASVEEHSEHAVEEADAAL
jgi:hypothetical protein